MWAGKSTRLYNLYKQYSKKNVRILSVKHANDTRYKADDHICTHDQKKVPCIRLKSLMDIEIDNYDVVLIDEAQWFEDLLKFVESNFHKDIRVHIAGLNGDKNQKPFGQVNELSSYCAKEEMLYAMCEICGNDASFSKEREKNVSQTKVGGKEDYYVVCYKHINH